MLRFLFRLIFIAIVLGLIAFVIYSIGGAAVENAKASAKELGGSGPMFAIGFLFMSVIITLVTGGGGGQK